MGRFSSLKNINNDNLTVDDQNLYKSNFNFEEFEITDNLFIEEIRSIEDKLYKAWNVVQHKTKEMCKYLYEAQEKFKTQKDGSFMAWYQSLGLTKDQVSISIMKYKQYLASGNPKALDSSVRTVKYLNQNSKNLSKEKIQEIIDNPEEASQIIKKIRNDKLEYVEIIDKEAEKIKIEEEIKKLQEKIEILKEKLKTL